MPFWSSLPLIALAIELLVAGLIWRLARTPGWAHLRSFTWVSLTAAGFTGATFWLEQPDMGEAQVVWAARVAQTMAAWHIAAWFRHAFARSDEPVRRRSRGAVRVLMVVGLVPLWPGATLSAPVWSLQIPGPHAPYSLPTILPAGALFSVLVPSLLVVPLVSYARRWRRGDVDARAYLVGIACFFVGAATEVIVPLAKVPLPVLGDVGFIGVVMAVLANALRQLSADAARLEALTVRLEAEVEDQSRELEKAWRLLASTERLAALGELSAKVAHEVNNPLAWVASNLRYIEAHCRGDPELKEALADATEGARRIAEVIARLGAQAAASSRAAPEVLHFGALLRTAIEVVRAQGHAAAALHVEGEVGPRFGDRAQVQRLLVELLLVLARATRPAEATRPFSVSLSSTAEAVELRLSGEGLPAPVPDGPAAPELVVARAIVRSLRGSLDVPAEAPLRLIVQLPLPPFDPSAGAEAA